MILVTGSTGLLGQIIVHTLVQQGHTVRGLVRRRDHPVIRTFPQDVEVVEGDVEDVASLEAAVESCSHVINTAGIVSYWRGDWPRMQAVHQEGTANLVNTCLAFNVEKLVHVSSTAALGRSADGEFIDEDHPFKNTQYDTLYGYAKYLAEKEIYRGVQEGLAAVMCNPAIILSPTNPGQSSGRLIAMAQRGTRYYPTGANGFVGVWDVAEAIRLLLHAPYREGERFILSAENLSYLTVLTQLAQAFGYRVPKRPFSLSLMHFMALFMEPWAKLTGRPPMMTHQSAITLSHRFFYDNSRFCEALHYQFTPISEVIPQVVQALQTPQAHAATSER